MSETMMTSLGDGWRVDTVKTLHTWIDPSSSSSFWRIVYGPAPIGMGYEFDKGEGWVPFTPSLLTLTKEILRLVREVETLSAQALAADTAAEALTVEVFHQAGEHPPFIVAVNGRVTTDGLAQIEKQMDAEAELLFTVGSGTYLCRPSYEYPTGDPGDSGGWAVERAELLEPLVFPDALLAALEDDSGHAIADEHGSAAAPTSAGVE